MAALKSDFHKSGLWPSIESFVRNRRFQSRLRLHWYPIQCTSTHRVFHDASQGDLLHLGGACLGMAGCRGPGHVSCSSLGGSHGNSRVAVLQVSCLTYQATSMVPDILTPSPAQHIHRNSAGEEVLSADGCRQLTGCNWVPLLYADGFGCLQEITTTWEQRKLQSSCPVDTVATFEDIVPENADIAVSRAHVSEFMIYISNLQLSFSLPAHPHPPINIYYTPSINISDSTCPPIPRTHSISIFLSPILGLTGTLEVSFAVIISILPATIILRLRLELNMQC